MFDKNYFIKKVEDLYETDFMQLDMGSGGCHCMIGHCGVGRPDWKHTEESIALSKLLDKDFNKNVGDEVFGDDLIIKINDDFPRRKLRENWLRILNKLD